MKNFLPLLSVGGFEVYFGIYELSTNLHHLTSTHFHICTNDDGNDMQISWRIVTDAYCTLRPSIFLQFPPNPNYQELPITTGLSLSLLLISTDPCCNLGRIECVCLSQIQRQIQCAWYSRAQNGGRYFWQRWIQTIGFGSVLTF